MVEYLKLATAKERSCLDQPFLMVEYLKLATAKRTKLYRFAVAPLF